METNGKTTFGSTLKADVTSAPDAIVATSTESLSGNEALRAKYDERHSQGPSAWFNDGKEERELILKMGEPWEDVNVLEIGCGEGELAKMMYDKGAHVVGLDYSDIAMDRVVDVVLSLFVQDVVGIKRQ